MTQLRLLPDLAKAGATTAGDLMTAPAVLTEADGTLARAARTMATARVKTLPVVDADGRLCGIVSRGDLLKVFLRGDEEIAEAVHREIVGSLFPADSSTVRVRVAAGVVSLSGRIGDTAWALVAARLAGAVEGVVDVRWNLGPTGAHSPEPPVAGTQFCSRRIRADAHPGAETHVRGRRHCGPMSAHSRAHCASRRRSRRDRTKA